MTTRMHVMCDDNDNDSDSDNDNDNNDVVNWEIYYFYNVFMYLH